MLALVPGTHPAPGAGANTDAHRARATNAILDGSPNLITST
jgi:hypothetical protein